jgi:hypothetical protein
VKDATHDTTIIIYDYNRDSLSYAGNGISPAIQGNMLSFTLSFTPTWIAFDSLKQTLSNGSLVKVGALDLQILDFKVQKKERSNLATFVLDDNSINTDIVLERSGDGRTFTDLGLMNLVNTHPTKDYSFEDLTPLSGTNYYRVRFINQLGQPFYSKIIRVSNTKSGRFTLSKNINDPYLAINQREAALHNTDASFFIYDASGKLTTREFRRITGPQTRLNISNLPKGVYTIRIMPADGEMESLKFVVN